MSVNFLPNDKLLKEELNKRLLTLERHLSGDVMSFSGAISEGLSPKVLGVIEDLAKSKNKRDTLYIILTTTGGSANAVDRYVDIIRHHYEVVNFIVPDYAYSAGTIFCMSGDNIYMDYYSFIVELKMCFCNRYCYGIHFSKFLKRRLTFHSKKVF